MQANYDALTGLEMVDKLYQKLKKVIEQSTPEYKRPFFPKPWWSAQLADSLEKRETAFRVYKRRSPQNLMIWKRIRAEHRRKVAEHKKKSQREMTENMNSNTPTKKVWDAIRSIKGRPARTVNILEETEIKFTTRDICNKLVDTFEKVTKSSNYSPTFQLCKQTEEAIQIYFLSSNEEVYNRIISEAELKYALEKTKDTTPGQDNITYAMLRSLPEEVMPYMLQMYNKLYRTNSFPNQWRESLIVPIPRPDKSHSSPYNYRPIALTSTMGKTIERILNNRLLDYLERTPDFARIQTGGLRGRGTIGHLVRLEAVLRNAFVNEEQVMSLFFDLEKAYDLTWKYGIHRELHRLGLRGRLPL